MNLCDKKHAKIIFEEKQCPFCKYINFTEAKIEGLRIEIRALKIDFDILYNKEEQNVR